MTELFLLNQAFSLTTILDSALVKINQLSLEMFGSINNFYKEEFEQDKNVRTLWYLFCYHFLPVINKDWKDCLTGSRVLKRVFLYEYISTSDEAMVLWFLKNWVPKIKDQAEKKWPGLPKTPVEGEQELKSGLKEYIQYHSLISTFKNKENGELACKWNDIFWEEMVANNPNIFNNKNSENKQELVVMEQQSNEDVVVLPGIDDDNDDLIGCFSKRKSLKKNNASINTLTTNKEGENGSANQDLQNTTNSQSHCNSISGSIADNQDQQIPSVNPNSDTDNLPNGLPNGLFLEEITNITQC